MLLPMSAAASTVGMGTSLLGAGCAILSIMGSQRLQSCVLWATELHHGQWREGKTPVPYICHPLEVLETLRYSGDVEDDDMLCAAVLHDVVEETSASVEDVKDRCGAGVAELVRELTREEPEPEQIAGLDKEQVWQLRADLLLQEIMAMSPRAKTIKLCDRISNLREARFVKSGKKLDRYVMQTRRILDVVPKKTHPPLWEILRTEADSFGGRT